MNCKQGDLALVIRGVNAGKVVRVISAVSPHELIPTSLGISLRILPENLPVWHVDREMEVGVLSPSEIEIPATSRVAWDSYLLPLRPPAADETDTAEREVTEGLSLT